MTQRSAVWHVAPAVFVIVRLMLIVIKIIFVRCYEINVLLFVESFLRAICTVLFLLLYIYA